MCGSSYSYYDDISRIDSRSVGTILCSAYVGGIRDYQVAEAVISPTEDKKSCYSDVLVKFTNYYVEYVDLKGEYERFTLSSYKNKHSCYLFADAFGIFCIHISIEASPPVVILYFLSFQGDTSVAILIVLC